MILNLALSWVEKGTKLPKLRLSENKFFTGFETKKGLSPVEKGTKSLKNTTVENKQVMDTKDKKRLSLLEKGTKSLSKKLHYIVVILSMSGMPISVDELMEIFAYQNRTKFRDGYIKPLEAVGFIKKTHSDKPNSPNQKYLLTETGKRFLTEKFEQDMNKIFREVIGKN
jgi:predicted transcriptional regulator